MAYCRTVLNLSIIIRLRGCRMYDRVRGFSRFFAFFALVIVGISRGATSRAADVRVRVTVKHQSPVKTR